MRATLLVVTTVLVLGSLIYLAEARRYPWGTGDQPGPAVYPVLVGLLLLGSSFGMGVEAALRAPVGGLAWPEAAGRWRVVAIVAATLGYIFLLPYLGHPLAGTLATLVVLHVMGTRRWRAKIGLALAAGFGSHYLFAGLLGVPLPVGAWLFG